MTNQTLVLLTDEQRALFHAYCVQEQDIYRSRAEQLQKLGSPGMAVRLDQSRAVAFGVVAADVKPAERETLVADDVDTASVIPHSH